MKNHNNLRQATIFSIAVFAAAGAQAQTKLKWAHVYETSEPYHTESVWAAEEIKKRTGGKYGLISMCCGGGLGTGTLIERL